MTSCAFYKLLVECDTPERRAIVWRGGAVSWEKLAAMTVFAEQELRGCRTSRVGLVASLNPATFAALAALDRLECDAFLLSAQLSHSSQLAIAQSLGLRWIVSPDVRDVAKGYLVDSVGDNDAWSGRSTVTILTSGTAGAPKAVQHTWDSLLRPTRASKSGINPIWFLAFPPNLYAGLQVISQCFVDHGTLVLNVPDAAASDIARILAESGVTCISATPSFWRRLILFADPAALSRVNLERITLGGEVVDQNILDLLSQRFPGVPIVHIYATSELGRCFSVSDGREGFPASFMDTKSPDGIEMRIKDGELMVRSGNSMIGYDNYGALTQMDSDWFATGDLVEKRGDRVCFRGRSTDIINVGGNKVNPLEVEQCLRDVKGVRDIRVYGISSSIAGELVACDIVLDNGYQEAEVKRNLNSYCQTHIATYQRPRYIEFADEIVVSDAGKRLRRLRST